MRRKGDDDPVFKLSSKETKLVHFQIRYALGGVDEVLRASEITWAALWPTREASVLLEDRSFFAFRARRFVFEDDVRSMLLQFAPMHMRLLAERALGTMKRILEAA